MRVKMLLEILNYGSLELVTSKDIAVVDTLGREANLSKQSQLFSSEGNLLTADIRHFHFQFHDKLVINVGAGRCW